MIGPVEVEVEYHIGQHPSQTMRGFLHADQFPSGPSLVMNPDAFRVRHACCWSIPWKQVLRVSVVADTIDDSYEAEIADALAGHP